MSMLEQVGGKVAGGGLERLFYLLLLCATTLSFLVTAHGILNSYGVNIVTFESKSRFEEAGLAAPAIVVCVDRYTSPVMSFFDLTSKPCSGVQGVQGGLTAFFESGTSAVCLQNVTANISGFSDSSECLEFRVPAQPRVDTVGIGFQLFAQPQFPSHYHTIWWRDAASKTLSYPEFFQPVGWDTRIHVHFVKEVSPNAEEVRTDVRFSATPQDKAQGTLMVAFDEFMTVIETKPKGAGAVWAELGGAWGAAGLIMAIFFVQKSVPGKDKTSPASEVQVVRIRPNSNRRELLVELARMMQADEECSKEQEVELVAV